MPNKVWYVRVTLQRQGTYHYNIEVGREKAARLVEKALLVIFTQMQADYSIRLEKDAPGVEWYG